MEKQINWIDNKSSEKLIWHEQKANDPIQAICWLARARNQVLNHEYLSLCLEWGEITQEQFDWFVENQGESNYASLAMKSLINRLINNQDSK